MDGWEPTVREDLDMNSFLETALGAIRREKKYKKLLISTKAIWTTVTQEPHRWVGSYYCTVHEDLDRISFLETALGAVRREKV